ncbi:MAG: pectate lyase [Candidatus Latescibacteria bacterium]|nr:pectate lyase [Candidatus Latescibacterota bacterium]
MQINFRSIIIFGCLIACCASENYKCYADPTENEVLAVMKKAAGFMANTVSYRGGYVYSYSEDLSQQWGEIPARKTQIWTQPPGTPTVGMMYLKAYKVTGEQEFLDYAERAANALIWGQRPAGGWQYLIDFDMPGLRTWYDKVASQCWGWEEYYHYYGNCTFDDAATSAPTEFLLELYVTTLDPKYKPALIKALDFILDSQYPNGGWPQRYPLIFDYPHDGHEDYTHFYTYNDGVIINNIELLLDAYEKLGDEAYRKAAVRGMDFYIISQLPKPQAGWAQQYTMDIKPGWARTYEPAAVSAHRTVNNINDLMRFYKITGDRRYLSPIPSAIEWLENSIINTDTSKKFTHTGFYEPVTNKPLYYHFTGTSKETMKHWVDYDSTGGWWYRKQFNPDITGIKRAYKRIYSLTPTEAVAEYKAEKNPINTSPKPSPERITEILSSIDKRGAWITDIQITDYSKGMLSLSPKTIKGINISVYIGNMNLLIDYLKQ